MSKFLRLLALSSFSLMGLFMSNGAPVHASTDFFVDDFGPTWTPGTTWSLADGGIFAPVIHTDQAQTPTSALRLTPATQQQSGGLLYNTPIPTEFGLNIAFHFSMWGGTGADGINFMLQKGTETSTVMPPGGSLGYSADRLSTPNKNGLAGGLLGIGFDMFGNHAADQLGGTGCTGPVVPQTANSLVVRGPGDLLAGYCRLALVTDSDTAWNTGTSSRADRARLVRVVLDPASVTPRQVKIWLCAPNTACSESGTPKVTVNAPAELLAEPTVRFGFAASTGGVTNNHEIWGLSVKSQVPVTYSLTYELGGGTGTLPAAVTGLNAGATTPLAAGTGLSRTGYTFAGWNCDNSIGDASAGSSLTQPAGNVICTANWTRNTGLLPSTGNNALQTALIALLSIVAGRALINRMASRTK